MSRDFLFKTDEFVFSYRVAGVLIKNGKILLQRDLNGAHAIVGGHVSFGETTEETLKREFVEEINAKIGVDRLLAVQENFFMWGDKPCQQVQFYYFAHLEDESFPLEGVIHGFDELGGERIDLDYLWVPLEELDQLTIYPRELIPHFKNPPQNIIHFVTNQLK